MTQFFIDTDSDPMAGYGRLDYVQVLRDAAYDAAGHNADQAQIDAELARLIVADLTAPKRAETARAHLLRYWPLIAPMAKTSPASFDWILTEFAERLGELN